MRKVHWQLSQMQQPVIRLRWQLLFHIEGMLGNICVITFVWLIDKYAKKKMRGGKYFFSALHSWSMCHRPWCSLFSSFKVGFWEILSADCQLSKLTLLTHVNPYTAHISLLSGAKSTTPPSNIFMGLWPTLLIFLSLFEYHWIPAYLSHKLSQVNKEKILCCAMGMLWSERLVKWESE